MAKFVLSFSCDCFFCWCHNAASENINAPNVYNPFFSCWYSLNTIQFSAPWCSAIAQHIFKIPHRIEYSILTRIFNWIIKMLICRTHFRYQHAMRWHAMRYTHSHSFFFCFIFYMKVQRKKCDRIYFVWYVGCRTFFFFSINQNKNENVSERKIGIPCIFHSFLLWRFLFDIFFWYFTF